MKTTCVMTAITSTTTAILSQVLGLLGGVDITVSTEDGMMVHNHRLSVAFLPSGTIRFNSQDFRRAPHVGYYDSNDPQQVANLISWVKTVMEA